MQVVRVHDLQFGIPNQACRFRAETLLTKEPATIAWIDSMPVGSVLYDIGANVGVYSLYAASKGHRVFAFEPVPASYAVLCRNVAINDLGNLVTPFCLALGRAGEIRRHVTPHEAGIGRMEFAERGLAVVVMSLDAVVAHFHLADPTHIKIDVDGGEADIIDGAIGAINRASSVIVETDERQPAAKANVDRLMGLHRFTLTGRHVCPLTPNSPIGMDHHHRMQGS